ncbi:hypothetical protein ANO14919_027180 [Xylariales sp. No.14919]|nr:hypothetical protein ANO14919_027180 [Xylariales sp. No.14919]
MAPQKRKHPHDAGPEPYVPDAVPRRSTRQHPDAGTAESEHQLRSGRVRANAIEKASGAEAVRPGSRGKQTDAPKSKPKTSTTDPAVATAPARANRHNKSAAAAVMSPVSPISPTSKENVRPTTPPGRGERRVAQPKLSRHRAHTRSRSPSQPKPRLASPSQCRTVAPTSSQRPTRPVPTAASLDLAPGATAVSIPPKRTPSNKNKITKTPGTPRSDRNIDTIVFGNTCFKAWYPSYYGKEVLGDVSTNVGGGNAKMGGGKRDPPMLDRLYICPCCFKYSKEMVPWQMHVQYCERRAFVPGAKIYTHPRHCKTVKIPHTNSTSTSPIGAAKGKGKSKSGENAQSTGDSIFSEGEWSVWEVDGEKNGLFCQNLSLFAKLFLDNKSVFFDVTGFNYFLLVYTPPVTETNPASPILNDPALETRVDSEIPAPVSANSQLGASPTSLSQRPRPQIVGFFSKEQMSWDNNNLACILVFPPWQRKGLGTLLMGVSYEISRREGILGGPEKPISELGRKGYKRFWAGEITRWILELDLPASSTESTHAARYTRREKEKEKDRGKDKAEEEEVLIVDVEKCSRDTWIVPEDCLAVLREMRVLEAGSGTPKGERDTGVDANGDTTTHGREKEEKGPKLPPAPRVIIDKAAVRSWARENRIDLTRACDPDGFVEGYAIKRVEDNDEEE